MGRRLTKCSEDLASPEKGARENLRRRLEDVRLLPIEDLNLAQPLKLLKSHLGYTMQLLTGMCPIRSLIGEPGSKDLSGFYLKTGGLRRRLQLLSRTAKLLHRLHARAIVYSDLSPNNVFVSESLEHSEVWLIDTDNIHWESIRGPGLFTPGFGAPELVSGRSGITTLSDTWSFAILSVWVLAQVHPFLGDGVEQGGWDAEVDGEQRAFAGELPWIEDRSDSSNRTRHGIDRKFVLSTDLYELCERTFGPGRRDPGARPSIGQWAEALARAADRTITCVGCRWTFYAKEPSCPFCGKEPRPACIAIRVSRWDPQVPAEVPVPGSAPIYTQLADASGEFTIRRSLLEPLSLAVDDSDALKVELVPRGLKITPRDLTLPVMVEWGGKRVALEGPTKLALPSAGHSLVLRCGNPDSSHRVLTISFHAANK